MWQRDGGDDDDEIFGLRKGGTADLRGVRLEEEEAEEDDATIFRVCGLQLSFLSVLSVSVVALSKDASSADDLAVYFGTLVIETTPMISNVKGWFRPYPQGEE